MEAFGGAVLKVPAEDLKWRNAPFFVREVQVDLLIWGENGGGVIVSRRELSIVWRPITCHSI